MARRSVTMVELVERHRFSVEDYERMVETGILGEDARVELIRGEICVAEPMTERHVASVLRLNTMFGSLVPRALLHVQGPIRLPDSMPEPDLALLRRRDDFYVSGLPRAADILLVVEVSDTRKRHDLQVKGPLYAENGIPEHWLLDLPADEILVFTDPAGSEYRRVRRARRGETVAPLAFPDFVLRVDDLLP